MNTIETILGRLAEQDIHAIPVHPLPSFLDPSEEISGRSIDWLFNAKQTDEPVALEDTGAESMSLASMTAMHVLDLTSGLRVLDVCSAPGMKALYANLAYDCLEYCVNDVSGDRLARLSRLFTKHRLSQPATITKYDGRFIDRAYPEEHFDRLIVDAPCSGEGVILGGSEKLLDAWSPAKIKRLQQLQIGILKSAWKLLKPGGRLVYSTCTLNKNENERVIKKALGFMVTIRESELEIDTTPQLADKEAWRIMPSKNSIGFFIAALDKSVDY